MLLLIDNYDSFTYNLYQYITQLYDGEVRVFRNDKIDIKRIEERARQDVGLQHIPHHPQHAASHGEEANDEDVSYAFESVGHRDGCPVSHRVGGSQSGISRRL